jgi:transcription initiation factor IIE alpha subunit
MNIFEDAVAHLREFVDALQEKYGLSDQEIADVLDIVLNELRP